MILTDVLKSWPGYELYALKFKQIQVNFLSRGCEIYTQNDGIDGYNVLNHGDFHYKNIMVNRDEDKIRKLMLVRLFKKKKPGFSIILIYFTNVTI